MSTMVRFFFLWELCHKRLCSQSPIFTRNQILKGIAWASFLRNCWHAHHGAWTIWEVQVHCKAEGALQRGTVSRGNLSWGLKKSTVRLATVLREAWLWWQRYLIVPCISGHEALLGKIIRFSEMSSAGLDPCLIQTHGWAWAHSQCPRCLFFWGHAKFPLLLSAH